MTEQQKPRNLVDICKHEGWQFHLSVNGNSYCRLRMGQKIQCPYQAKMKDSNGIYPCMNLYLIGPPVFEAYGGSNKQQ